MELTDEFIAEVEQRTADHRAVAGDRSTSVPPRARIIRSVPMPMPVPAPSFDEVALEEVALEEVALGEVAPDADADAVAIDTGERPAILLTGPGATAAILVDDDRGDERFIGRDDLVDDTFADLIIVAARPVARLALTRNGRPAFATGFMVSPDLLMTNEHVLRSPDDADGFAEFDFRYEMTTALRPAVRFKLAADEFFWNDRDLDVALVAVSSTSSSAPTRTRDFGYHRLIGAKGKVDPGAPITIIQHPGGDPRKVAVRENELLRYIDDNWLEYQSDTAQGSSGAPCFSDDFQLVALHSHGEPKRVGEQYELIDGRLVDSLRGIDDASVNWVANQGARTSAIVARLRDGSLDRATGSRVEACVDGLLRAMDGGHDVVSSARDGSSSVTWSDHVPPSPGPAQPDDGRHELDVRGDGSAGARRVDHDPAAFDGAADANGEGFIVHVPIRISPVGWGGAPVPGSRPAAPAATAPELDEVATTSTFIDPDFTNRTGYDPDFLGAGLSVPLPEVDPDLLVVVDGSTTIPYEHFSLALLRKRRIAAFVAANVDYRPLVRFKHLTRQKMKEGNGGERWAVDPRVAEDAQVPDVFYDRDRRSFDKGHLLRRDDVCWGATEQIVRRANGDTFHLTNCSPQVAAFNQASDGERNWGDLEDLIGDQEVPERCCVFSGPVLHQNDPIFHGVGNRGQSLDVKIPRSFWKVVVAATDGALTSWAFVLRQSLADVRMEELVVPPEWDEARLTVAELEDRLDVTFPEVVHASDVLA